MSVTNRPLDNEPLVHEVAGLLGEPQLIGTDQFIAFLETLTSSVNTTIVVVEKTTASSDQLSVAVGRLGTALPRQIDAAFARVVTDPGLPARLRVQLGDMRALIGQQVAAVSAALGEMRAIQQKMNERLAQVEALCQSNLVR
jgi:hypothetical protein